MHPSGIIFERFDIATVLVACALVVIRHIQRLVALAQALDTSVGYLLNEDGLDLPEWEQLDRVFSEEPMLAFVKGAAVRNGLAQTLIALEVSQEAHTGQTRKGSNVAYINHPLAMFCHALAMGIDQDDVLAAILLHDVVEDFAGCYTLQTLPVNVTVRGLVDLLTWQPDTDDGEARRRYYERIATDPDAMFIKALDRCNNLSLMVAALSKARIITYIEETETHILPMMEMLMHRHPRYGNAMFLLKYQMVTLMETVKRLLR